MTPQADHVRTGGATLGESRVRASNTGPLASPSLRRSRNTVASRPPIGAGLETETLAMRSHPHFRLIFRALVLAMVVITLAGSIALASDQESMVSVTDEDQRILGENALRDVSDDGRFVLFASDSASVGPATPGEFESYLYVRDRLAGTTRLVIPANPVSFAGMSDDGSVIALSTGEALTPADTNGLEDVYVLRTGQSPQLVSTRSGAVHTTGSASDVIISADGSVVAFTAYASADLVAGDTSGFFRRNGMIAVLSTGDITRVPFPPVSAAEEVGSAQPRALSNDGSLVLVSAFVTGPDELERPVLRDVLYLWNRPANRVTVIDDSPYDLTVVSRVVEFSPAGERLHVVTSGPAGSLTQTVTVHTIETSTGAVVARRSFEAPESLVLDADAMTPVPSYWRASVSADGNRVALYQAPWGTTVWVHDLNSGESIAQATGFPPSIGLFEFSLTGEGSALVFERAATDVAGVVDVFSSDIGASVFSDTGASIFRRDVLWLFDKGITQGCTPAGSEFCPDDPVTRGQMAAFINRALALPASDLDRFTDDDGSIFEADIQALAAAGITLGCNLEGTEFCPADPVTRGQIAAFLDRALDLVGSDDDRFTDDDGSMFEPNIQALAAAGITRGCNSEGTLFCLDEPVTRGQMAALLRRGLDDPIQAP